MPSHSRAKRPKSTHTCPHARRPDAGSAPGLPQVSCTVAHTCTFSLAPTSCDFKWHPPPTANACWPAGRLASHAVNSSSSFSARGTPRTSWHATAKSRSELLASNVQSRD
eukprot:CAMPEP_0198592240 /NCGR_PEP_ID=MMETSP1462-20131121/137877_1 /TAXON_ID=1333877 /ORGANISM="Brandtodinium nutriculum, Strain RCC3387" /LENGTH=109 /DNA_ID=CAMNT_0044323817 /DNA_START=165 /DNA_END=491 /DNA_ORIENTATION=-